MDFCHLIVTCLFSMLRLPFDNQKVKGNYAIFLEKCREFRKQMPGIRKDKIQPSPYFLIFHSKDASHLQIKTIFVFK